jgi:hypothetical protein
LTLQQVEADLKLPSFAGGVWSGEEVLAQRGTLRLGRVVGGAARRAGEPPGPDSAFPFEFTRYRCLRLELLFGREGRPPLRIEDIEASLSVRPGSDQLRLVGGVLKSDGWPDLPIERGLIEFGDGDVSISSLTLGDGSGRSGVATIEGRFDPAATGPVMLDVRLEEFPFEWLVGGRFVRLLDVTFDSDATLSFVPGQADSYELVVPFRASTGTEGVLGELPFLQLLREQFPGSMLAERGPHFVTESAGVLRRGADGLAVERLRLEEHNLVAVRGSIAMGPGGELSGDLDVGVAERLAKGHPAPSFGQVFARRNDGYWWATVHLSGTIDRPVDDLAETLRKAAEAAGNRPAPGEPDSPEAALEREFRDLTEGAAGTTDR